MIYTKINNVAFDMNNRFEKDNSFILNENKWIWKYKLVNIW